MTETRIELYKAGVLRKQWFFRFVAANGKKVAYGEGYRNKADAVDTIELVRQQFADAPIIER